MSASTAISSYKEMIQVPTELLEFAQHPSFHSTLLSVRDQSSTNYLCLNRNTETGVPHLLCGIFAYTHVLYRWVVYPY